MRSYKFWAGLVLLALFWGAVTLTKADSPTEEKDKVVPDPAQRSEFVVDPTKTSITQLSLITSTVSFSSTKSISKTVAFSSPHPPTRLGPASGDIRAATYFIGVEDFESTFPQPGWALSDNNGAGYLWGDVRCFPIETTFQGLWSGWPASRGTNGLDPCSGNTTYPPNMDSALIYGPFSLADAQYADVQFFYRIISEQGFDFLGWYTSTNGTTFSLVDEVSGVHISGPYNNGYNEVIFNLIPELGQSQVWIAFRFRSDGSNQFQGPFIDFINILVEEKNSIDTFLPIIIKNPPPITQLYVKNNTPGSVTFTVSNTPQGNIACNIPTGQTLFCGQFTPGTYNATSNAAACPPPTTKSKAFGAGPVTLTVVCK